jgi:hypothetical protein
MIVMLRMFLHKHSVNFQIDFGVRGSAGVYVDRIGVNQKV